MPSAPSHRRASAGVTSASSAMLVVVVAIVGVSSLPGLGGAMDGAIAGDAGGDGDAASRGDAGGNVSPGQGAPVGPSIQAGFTAGFLHAAEALVRTARTAAEADDLVALAYAKHGWHRPLMTMPRRAWEFVGGYADVRDALRSRVVEPLKHYVHHKGEQRGVHSVLIHGGAGSGKTTMLEALASEPGVHVFRYNPGDALAQDSISTLRSAFRRAHLHPGPTVLVFDDLERVVPHLKHGESERAKIFHAELQRLKKSRHHLTIVATANRLDEIPANILEEFEMHLSLAPPDAATRAEIIAVHLRGKRMGEDFSVASLVDATAGFSAGRLRRVIDEAWQQAVARAVREGRSPESAVLTDSGVAAQIREITGRRR